MKLRSSFAIKEEGFIKSQDLFTNEHLTLEGAEYISIYKFGDDEMALEFVDEKDLRFVIYIPNNLKVIEKDET